MKAPDVEKLLQVITQYNRMYEERLTFGTSSGIVALTWGLTSKVHLHIKPWFAVLVALLGIGFVMWDQHRKMKLLREQCGLESCPPPKATV